MSISDEEQLKACKSMALIGMCIIKDDKVVDPLTIKIKCNKRGEQCIIIKK